MKQFLRLGLWVVFNCLILNRIAFSQTNTKYFLPVVLASPTASDLEKFGNLPVTLSTATTTAQIPLCNFGLKNNLNLSKSLNYSTNEVLVDATAGLNRTSWSFTGEYCIRRSVFDDRDETSEGLIKALNSRFNVLELNKLITYGGNVRKDFQPDLFALVASGFQGSIL